MADKPKASDMPFSFWINVALSFAFVFLGVVFVFWSCFCGRWDWKVSVSNGIRIAGWAILAIGLGLGVFNAYRYYTGRVFGLMHNLKP